MTDQMTTQMPTDMTTETAELTTKQRLAQIEARLDYIIQFIHNIQSAMMGLQENPMLRVLMRNAGMIDDSNG
jgi:hypothetical protein